MKKIVGYLRDYVQQTNKTYFVTVTLFTALAVFINYYFGLNKQIARLTPPLQFGAWYAVFVSAFGFGYCLQEALLRSRLFYNKKFLALFLLAPAIFAWKMSAQLQFNFTTNLSANEYWNAVVYWPFKVLVVTLALFFVHRFFNRGESFYGATVNGFDQKPFAIMLLVMIPLIAAASTQNDFLRMYPRFQSIAYLLPPNRGWHKLLYELSYGTDFFSIELFFRGFLVLAFAKWAGKDAVLPMAIFYCTIHFGKPVGECISSYFGGIILGVVAYRTRNIFGGFLVHVGIAWLMELGGYIGHQIV